MRTTMCLFRGKTFALSLGAVAISSLSITLCSFGGPFQSDQSKAQDLSALQEQIKQVSSLLDQFAVGVSAYERAILAFRKHDPDSASHVPLEVSRAMDPEPAEKYLYPALHKMLQVPVSMEGSGTRGFTESEEVKRLHAKMWFAFFAAIEERIDPKFKEKEIRRFKRLREARNKEVSN